jgi:sortase A
MQTQIPKKGRLLMAAATVAILAGTYILLVSFAPWLPASPLLGTQKVDVNAMLSGTNPGERGNRIYIPQLGVDLPFAEGDARVLEAGAWHRQPQNGDPEKGGNFILSAHRFEMGWTPGQTVQKSPFYRIDRLKKDDEFFVDYNGNRYAYKVARLYGVPRTATAIEGPSDTAKLTLYSCDLRGESAGRVVVEALPLGKV